MEPDEKPDNADGRAFPLAEMLAVMFQHRWAILKYSFLVTIVVTALSFLVPNRYRATAVILPDIELLSSAQKLGGLRDIASSVGFNLDVTSPSQFYPDILSSETILGTILRREFSVPGMEKAMTLIEYFGFDQPDTLLAFEKALRYFRDEVVSIDLNKKTGVLTLQVETKDPLLSAQIANAMTDELDEFQRAFRRTNASEQRVFLQERLDQIAVDLERAEDSLKQFREKNRRIGDSPELLLEQARLERGVTLNTSVFVELKKQDELVKLDEIKNTPVVQVLDPARPPARKSWPKRSLVGLSSFLIVCIGLCAWFLIRQRYLALELSGGLTPSARFIRDGLKADWQRIRSRSSR